MLEDGGGIAVGLVVRGVDVLLVVVLGRTMLALELL